MNSKKIEEVRKRRAKASPSRPNLYPKTFLVAGVLTLLLFLAIGLSPQWAFFLAGEVTGGALLISLIFQALRAKKERENRTASRETFPEGKEALEPEPISSTAEAEKIVDAPGVISLQTNPDALQGRIFPGEQGAFITPDLTVAGKEDWGLDQAFSGDGVLGQMQKKPAMLGDKAINLKDMLLSLEGNVAEIQQKHLGSDPKIDLRIMLANLDEKHKRNLSEAPLESRVKLGRGGARKM